MSLLKKFTNGEVAVEFKNEIDSIDDLNIVLGHCFPNDLLNAIGWFKYYFSNAADYDFWDAGDETSLPFYPLVDFLKEWEELK